MLLVNHNERKAGRKKRKEIEINSNGITLKIYLHKINEEANQKRTELTLRVKKI